MAKRRIRLEGPGAKGVVVNAALLRDLLTLVLDGSQRVLRMRTQGRSTARGSIPRWIAAASEIELQIVPGSTVLELEAPTLEEAGPEEFRQRDLFPEVDPHLTGIDYLAESLRAATSDEFSDTKLFDKPLLELFGEFDAVFQHGITSVTIEDHVRPGRRPVSLEPRKLVRVSELELKMPQPQEAILAGRLDAIRHSDRTFTLVTPHSRERIKGIADSEQELQSLWGHDVVASGLAHFTADGKVLRIEAANLRAANDRDLQLWATPPEPLGFRPVPNQVRVAQGARTGLNAIIGQWPGEETEEAIKTALETMS